MSTTTTNYGLIKPDTTDPILIGQLNDNSDAIDAALKENADAIENKPDAADIPTPSTVNPAMDGTAAAGTSTDYARADHVHPTDTSRASAASEAEDRAALIELVDGGAKNVTPVNMTTIAERNPGSTVTGNTITKDSHAYFTIANGEITIDSDGQNSQVILQICNYNDFTLTDNTDYVLSGCSGGSSATYDLRVALTGSTNYPQYSDPAIVSHGTETTPNLSIVVRANQTLSNVKIKPMLCIKAAWDISQTYQPYRPSYQELYDMVKALQATT